MLANRPPASANDNNYVHSLPPFANEVNRALSRQIKALEANLTELDAKIDDNSHRANAISSHLKNVQSETNHTQALYDAKSRQIDTEEHFKQLAERESGRIQSEMKRLDSELSRISDYLNLLQTNIYRGNEKIEGVRAEFKLETDELQEWLRVQTEKEEDNLALVKYTKEDDSRTKELSLAIEKLVTQVNKSKANLTAEVTETQVAQIELENTTEAFKQLHQERQNLIHQWEEAVQMMRARDVDIDNCQDDYRAQKVEISKVRDKFKEREELFEQQLALNGESEKNIILTERRVSKLRGEESDGAKSMQQYKDEVEVLKNTLNKFATDLVNKRADLVNLKQSLKERQVKLDTSKLHFSEMKVKVSNLDGKSESMEANADQLQEMLEKEKAKDKEYDKIIKSLREQQFKKSQVLFKLKQEEKNRAAEIVGGEAASKNLKAKIQKIDQDALKQRSMLYSMEFGVQQLERKIRRMEGERSDEEKNELLSKIKELNTKYDSQTDKWNTLNNQLKRSQEDLRQAKRQLETLEKSRLELNTNIGELNLYSESATHQLSSKVKEKENLLVDENILRLELRRLRSFVHARSDEVLTLETRKLTLNLALEERSKEIDIHKDMLRLQIKNAEDERHSATTELRDRVGKVEKLKRRYEILMTQFAPEDGEEEHSQAYYVIQASAKRQELQKEGDELDGNIRRAEKEIKALENTLGLMNDRNEQFRVNLYKAELDANDLQHKEMLDSEYQQVIDSFKSKRSQILDLQAKLSESERIFNAETAKEAETLQKVQILDAKCDAICREVDEQTKKKARALQFARKVAKQHRVKVGVTSGISLDEQDFLIRAHREVATLSLQDLEKLTNVYNDLAPNVQALMQSHGLQPPSRSVSRVTSRASSFGGSISQTSSGRNSVVFSEQGGDAPPTEQAKPVSRISTSMRGSKIDLSRSKSGGLSSTSAKAMSTTNLGDIVTLPPVGGSTSKLGSSMSLSGIGEVHQSRGSITGSGRIKGSTRPGSVQSNSSHGSKQSSNSKK